MTGAETAVIVGAGPGVGAALARCFLADGMNVAMAARDADRLRTQVGAEIGARDSAAGEARIYGCDATREVEVDELFERVGAELGAIQLVVYNAGAFVPGSILDIEPADFETCWRVGCFGGFLVGQRAARLMTGRTAAGGPGGTIIFTGATAALRGSAGFANLAVGKFGLRALAQSMARELGPRAVHVAHVVVDGVIAHPKVGGQTEDDARLNPDAIAAVYLMLHRQPKTAWTHEMDLRPWSETF